MNNKKDVHTIRCETKDFVVVSKFLKKANRSWKWFIKTLANMIKENENVNLTKLFGLAKKREGKAVSIWE